MAKPPTRSPITMMTATTMPAISPLLGDDDLPPEMDEEFEEVPLAG